ncbi:glycosyltransferase [Pelosinus sp. sgz500959]|uniref:glycosyltransferase n=1 Tax=Pelosinus sp. sgz500959 TaxID=3242472 RepID=UPI00366B3682
MRILYCTHTSEHYVGCAVLSDEQVVCGPNWPTRHSEHGYTHIQTPAGRFDIKVVIDRLPAHQKPDMIVVWADSSCVAQPYNLGCFSGPKVLLIADTHHMDRPIERVIAYAKSEPWDFLVAFDNRHHLHFFREAGCKNIFWLPGLNALAREMPFAVKRQKVMTFIGQTGRFHPRRKNFLDGLQQQGFPLQVLQIPGIQALQAYAQSLISLECTLNSNVGLRTFEVLSAGGMLLADRPSPHSGMDLLFEEGKHLLYYDSFHDLVDKSKYLLDHPQEVFQMALAGYQEVWANHSPEKKRQQLLDLVWHGMVEPRYDLTLEPRMKRNILVSGQSFPKRLDLYQQIQELHRKQEEVDILYRKEEGYDELIEDLLDLPRVHCNSIDETNLQQVWDFVIMPSQEVQTIEGNKSLPFSYKYLTSYDGFATIPLTDKVLPATKHILVYTDDPCFGGAAHFDHALTVGLRRAGYQVSIVQTYNEHSWVKERQLIGIKHLWLAYDTIKEFGKTVQQTDEPQKYFAAEKPDLIIFSDCCPFSNFAAKRVAIELKIPFIEVEHATVPFLAERFALLLDERERIYRKANAVIAVSHASKECLESLFRLPSDQGEVIYLGRPAKFFQPRNMTIRNRLRNDLGIPQEGVVCFTAARLDSLKGFDLQLAAIQRLHRTKVWDKLFFVWAGSGEREEEIGKIVTQAGLRSKVHVLGNRQDITDLLDASDIFVLPSFTEGLPLSIMEAMAKKMPVIASAVGGIPEILHDAGIVLPDPNLNTENTVHELARMIELLASDRKRCSIIGEQCYERAANLFTEEKMLENFIRVIEGRPLTPRISVLMSVYNGETYLRETIESILGQTFTDFEFLIVDDGSTDKSLEIIQSYHDPRIILLKNEHNMGLIKSLNRGLDVARGEFIARMDADDISKPERLAKQLTYLQEHPDIAVCGTWMETIGVSQSRIMGENSYPLDSKILKCLLLFYNAIAHPTVMLRADALSGSVQHRYSSGYHHGEDYKLWIDLAAEKNLANINEVLLYYRLSEEQVSHQYSDVQIGTAEKVYVEQLNRLRIEPSQEQLLVHRALHLSQFPADLGFIEAVGNWLIVLKNANAKRLYYPEPEFTLVLMRYWQAVCQVLIAEERIQHLYQQVMFILDKQSKQEEVHTAKEERKEKDAQRLIIVGEVSTWEKRCRLFKENGVEVVGFIGVDNHFTPWGKSLSYEILSLAQDCIEVQSEREMIRVPYDYLCFELNEQGKIQKLFAEVKVIGEAIPQIPFRDFFGIESMINATLDSDYVDELKFLPILNNRIQLNQCNLTNVSFAFQGSNNKVTIGKNVNLQNCYFHFTGSNNEVFINESNNLFYTHFKFYHECGGCKAILGKLVTINGAVFEYADDDTQIIIGDECLFSSGINFMTSDTHSVIDLTTRERVNFGRDIIVGNHVWVCKNVTVLKGVEIGKDSVVALGAVVAKSVPSNCIAGGSPAKVIKEQITWTEELIKKQQKIDDLDDSGGLI